MQMQYTVIMLHLCGALVKPHYNTIYAPEVQFSWVVGQCHSEAPPTKGDGTASAPTRVQSDIIEPGKCQWRRVREFGTLFEV